MTTPNPTAQQLRETTLAIWWTNQADCAVMPPTLAEGLPAYLRAQLVNRLSRNERWRLWIDDQFGEIKISPLPTTPLGDVLGYTSRGQTYAGIVIRDVDIPLLKDLPGIITDLKLRRY